MIASKLPATVVTGFLGAGKTTLVRHLLEHADGRRIALIVNEFGDLGVDGEVLKGCGIEGCSEDDVIELTNGCICCTVADDFIPTMEGLLAREPKPDHIVIETSGLALPQPLVDAFNWPGIRERVTVDGVVAVVDGAALAEGRFAHDHDALERQREADEGLDHESPLEELFEDQLRAADLVVLNKADLLEDGTVDGLRERVGAEMVAAPRVIAASHGRLPAEVLLGIGAATETAIGERRSHHEMEHADGEAHDHDHDDFASFSHEVGPVPAPEPFLSGLREVARRHDVLRMKGFVDVPGKPMRLLVQGVGGRFTHHFDRPWQPGERATRIVVIGLANMDEAALRAEIDALVRDADPNL